jgi:uncharacterized protein (UPF0332 family)
MDGRNFLTIADSLLAESSEAAWRSAVSRGYYAAFHVARRLLETLGFRVPRADKAHAYLWYRLSNAGDSEVQIAGQNLGDFRSRRNFADYDVARQLGQTAAVAQVQMAKLIIQVLDNAIIQPTRSTVTDAMQIYERDVLKDVTWQP